MSTPSPTDAPRGDERAPLDEAARLRLALLATGTGWLEWDVGSSAVSWGLPDSDGLRRVRPPTDVSEALALVDPASRVDVARRLRTAIHTAQPVDVEFRLDPDVRRITVDGDAPEWAWLHLTPVVDESGTVTKLVGLLRDVTSRRRAIAQLLESLERERAIASAVQRHLLPSSLPTVDGLPIAARYRPAGPDIVVGGDFYDVTAGEAGTITIHVGDVCGQGIDAAMVTSLARHTLRAAARQSDDVATHLRWLHDALVADSVDTFLTCVGARGRLDRDGFAVDIVLGGHPPPILIAPDRPARFVGSAGTLLGVVEPRLTVVHVHVPVGGRLILYTDGLTDSCSPRLEPDELLAAADRMPTDSVETMADMLLELSTPGEGSNFDDTALVVVGVGPT